MKNVDVSSQWSGGFVFVVGSKNNDLKIFQGLNSDSCCDLSVEMARGISSTKTKYHHANLCYRML